MGTIKRVSIVIVMAGLVASGCSSSNDSSSDGTSTTTTAAASSGDSANGLLAGVPDPDGASKESQDDVGSDGVHRYYTTTATPSEVVSSYTSALESNGWTIQNSGSGASWPGGGGGLTATNGARYLVLSVEGPAGAAFIDLCVWPSQPSDDSCSSDDNG